MNNVNRPSSIVNHGETRFAIGNRRSTAQGFSLIELLVSMALLAVIAGVGISIFAIINGSYTRANAISKMQTQGQQTLEQMERSIRSASSAVVVGNGQQGCNADQCLVLTVPTASIEYGLNGGCDKTIYAFTPAVEGQNPANGRIQRYSYGIDEACGPAAVDVFDTNASQGVSIESSSQVFSLTEAAGEPGQSVTIHLHLYQGMALKPDSGEDTRANVPLKTTVRLRNY